MNALKDILVDAARYRWLKGNNMVISFFDKDFECRKGVWGGLDGEQLDELIDAELASDE